MRDEKWHFVMMNITLAYFGSRGFVTDGAARGEAKLAWAIPKYRANESRVKLDWLCRVQPIFNEVNRDGGRQLVNPHVI